MSSETAKGGNDSEGVITQDLVEDLDDDLTLNDEDDKKRGEK